MGWFYPGSFLLGLAPTPTYTIDVVAMHPWIADRTEAFDSSGIRKVFDLAAKMTDPINLSIGQPDFDVPLEIQDAAIDAIRGGKNAYSPTQGIAPLREALARPRLRPQYPSSRPRRLCLQRDQRRIGLGDDGDGQSGRRGDLS